MSKRHIQDHASAESLEPHWGYADRVVPCTNDAGSCAYLDEVYGSHDRSMVYMGILWLTIAAILILWAVGRQSLRSRTPGVALPVRGEQQSRSLSATQRLRIAVPAALRRHLLPDAPRILFGRTTRLQVAVLAALAAYLIIWSFVGIGYNKWVTPVKNSPGVYNTRTSLGPWSDRVGIIAYALTPLSIALASRESILSLITGLPYQSFNFLHRWLGYIIFAQSALHTIGWCVIELRLYQPQPSVGIEWIKQLYMIWGVIAMFFLTALVILSTPWGIRMTGYEFFRKFHYVVACLYIGACWGHWAQLYCYLLPSLIMWGLDRAIRLVRTALLHYNYLPDGNMGFRCATADISFFPDPDPQGGDIVRLDFDHPHDAWNIGQHFYLCFPESSVWQSHPFTPLSLPIEGARAQRHSYIFRAKKGETRRIAELSARRCTRNSDKLTPGTDAKLSVVLNGPYGENITSDLPRDANILCIAGGTGVTYVLPLLMDLASRPQNSDRRFSLVWVVRHKQDMEWVAPELAALRSSARAMGLGIRVFVTRGGEEAALPPACNCQPSASDKEKEANQEIAPVANSSSSSDTSSQLSLHGVSKSELNMDHVHNRPHLQEIVTTFVNENVSGPTHVVASGPGGMISELRGVVAGVNDGGKVWRGETRWDVKLVCDDRLEW
ncbi:ferric-chelate reductase-like protein [Corynespora cassiicola Philippines]|uniref:Ferric-chelate reductase-like protein n=1 Tax=Corynespora cassiicola Philippines TaxID=1448308 RepID=A0A2T2NIQ8_CORCC|nr:ferric-chelate reductase-like protein [Corynespora cassiicola Philippines]